MILPHASFKGENCIFPFEVRTTSWTTFIFWILIGLPFQSYFKSHLFLPMFAGLCSLFPRRFDLCQCFVSFTRQYTIKLKPKDFNLWVITDSKWGGEGRWDDMHERGLDHIHHSGALKTKKKQQKYKRLPSTKGLVLAA